MGWRASYIRKMLGKKIPCDSRCSDYYRFGWEKFGPFLYGYVRWLYKNIKKTPVKKVFFFSRDGFMMDCAFQLINDKSIKTKYVYFSRRSIRQALLWRCSTFEESLQYLTWERFVSAGKMLEYYGFDEAERKNIVERYNIDISKNYEYDLLRSSNELKKLYLDLKPIIDQKSRKQNELLLGYLHQIDMLGECAIVDIGWHGSMQYFLEQFIEQHDMDTKIYGFYIGISPSYPLKGKVDGFLYEQNNLRLRKSLLCFLGGYERLFQSIEGSTCGYMKQGESIVPVLDRYEYQEHEEIISCIKEWQKGALEFIKEAMLVELQYQDEELSMPLVEFGRNPSMKDIRLFSALYNTDGVKSYYISQKRLFEYKMREFVLALSNSVWKTGFMKSVFKIPFPYYFIYCLMKK